MFFICDGTRNQQLNGCPIGKALSVPVAGIYMCWWEKQVQTNSNFNFKLWKRRRDDILIIWPYKQQELILEAVNEMNAIEERIQVTYELLEREGQKIPFLDIWVNREDNRIIITTGGLIITQCLSNLAVL